MPCTCKLTKRAFRDIDSSVSSEEDDRIRKRVERKECLFLWIENQGTQNTKAIKHEKRKKKRGVRDQDVDYLTIASACQFVCTLTTQT